MRAAVQKTAPDLSLQERDFEKVRALIYKETGMLFEANKNYYIESKIKQRMQETQVESFADYYHELVFGDRTKELKIFIEKITINETYFFRDFPQLQGFAEVVLSKYCLEKEKKDDRSVKIWSAACSTGEEAYTLSIILQEMIDRPKIWQLSIDASDIDRQVLGAAMKGVYSDRSMKDTPTPYREKYFNRSAEGWVVKDEARRIIDFHELNFMDRMEMRKVRGYDFIFCRNVLIYFDDESRKRVISSMFDSLVPGGYLFLGHSESVGRITAAFQLEKMGDFLCYRKPK